MNPVAEIWILFYCRNDVRMKISRERCSELDPRHSRHGYGSQESRERCRTWEILNPLLSSGSIAVHVLADKMDFFVTERLKPLDLVDNFVGRTTTLTAARVRNNTKRTKLIAPFDDRNECDVR